jgi:predicted DCC family thiol-disulfide oxidoreductase YuxK
MTNVDENAFGAAPRDGARPRRFALDARSLGLFRILVALWAGAFCIAPPVVSELAYRGDHAGLNHPSLGLAARLLGVLGALGLLKGFRCRASLALVLAALLAWGALSRRFDALNGGVLITMLAAMFLVPIGARFSFDSVANAMRRGVRLDRRPADGVPAATALGPSPRTVAFTVIAGTGALWTAALWAASHSVVPHRLAYELLCVPLATLVLLLSTRQWDALARAALRPSRPAYVYYDDSCGFCFRCCQWVALADGAARLTFIGASDRAAHQHAIPAADLETSVVVVDAVSGAVVRQARAAAAILRALPAPYHPLRIIAWPGIVWFADRAYDIVARNRHRISLWMGAPACGVDGHRTSPASSPTDPSRTRP